MGETNQIKIKQELAKLIDKNDATRVTKALFELIGLEGALLAVTDFAIAKTEQYKGKLQEPTFKWLAENLGQIDDHYKALRSPVIDR